jgi:outer membrane protein assembly factor BamE (lipoprotein component of BamABCDE complex)
MRSLVLLGGVVVMFACSHLDGPFVQIEGAHFDSTHVEDIADGLTLEPDVRRFFGTPLQVTEGDTRILRYYSVRRRENIETKLLRKTMHWQAVEQELVVRIHDGRVVNHTYSTKTTQGVK